MADIAVHFRNNRVMHVNDVAIEEAAARLIVHTGPGDRTVIPLSAIDFYDVEDPHA